MAEICERYTRKRGDVYPRHKDVVLLGRSCAGRRRSRHVCLGGRPVDALSSYIWVLGYPDDEAGEFSRFWPVDLHVIGKVILRFHPMYWPALLMAAGLEPPKRLLVHGWWTRDGKKISKSAGNVIGPLDVVQKYGVDPTRYFLLGEVPFGNDGDFSDTAFQNRVNSNLANEVGNFAMRTLSMAVKNCEGRVSLPVDAEGEGPIADRRALSLSTEDKRLLKSAGGCLDVVRPLVGEAQQLHKALDAILQVSRNVNEYIDVQAPCVLKKTDPERMKTVLWVLLENIRHVAILYQPFVPESAARLLDQLGVPQEDARLFTALAPGGSPHSLPPSAHLTKPVPDFPRIETLEEATA